MLDIGLVAGFERLAKMRRVLISFTGGLRRYTMSSCRNCFLESPFVNLNKSEPAASLVRGISFSPLRMGRYATGFTPLQPKPLASILDIESARGISPDRIASIWEDHHLSRGHIGFSMNSHLYHLLEQRTSQWYFAIPLKKGDGYTTMFAQAEMPYMIFTGLEDYKARGREATPYLTTSYYTDFVESKQLVLVRGDVVLPGRLADVDARWLLNTTQQFYLDDTRFNLVQRFNNNPSLFEFNDVLIALNMPIL